LFTLLYLNKYNLLFYIKIKPINSKAINDWQGKIEYNQYQMNFIVPMLKKFNYNLNKNDDFQQQQDDLVAKNNHLIDENKDFYDRLARNVSDHIKDIY